MTADKQTLLIPVLFPDPEAYPLDDAHLDGLDGFEITLLGYWEVPGGASREHVRERHQTEAEAVLYEMAARFSHAGASTDIRLHFGPGGTEKGELQDRILAETDPNAILIPERITAVHNVLVPLRDDRRLEEIVEFLSVFDQESIFVVELYHATPDETGIEAGEEMLAGVRETLLERGFSPADIEITVEVTDEPADAITRHANNHNAVVIGESEELEVESRFFGPTYEYMNGRTNTPIAVVRETAE